MSYGFGIVGLGLIADFHAKAIEATGKGQVVACCSRNQEKADAFGAKYTCQGYTDMDEFLRHPGLEIVTLCTPSGFHLEPALAAATAGKHLIVEKPLEITLDRCDQIIAACEKHTVKLAGVFQSRFSDVAKVLKTTLDEGRFGRLVLGDAYVKWYRSQQYYDEGGWHGTWKLDGGGALMNQSIHAIDLLQWFMGPVESVSAFTGTVGHERIEVEDVSVAALHFKNGAFGVIEGTTAIYPGFLKKLEISGTQGSAVLEEENLNVWAFADERAEDAAILEQFAATTDSGGGAADPGAISFQGHQRQFADFIDALETGRSPLVDGLEARKAVEIILAIYQSAREGRRVTLPV
ncbi:gfo/Idh/MocA family oxidoreductase [candidate division KSB3 bacterium]|uniref:Gfo/Idh/MocA family oxidoreductase n=1 Tax=candidate division KSB3 bacterium TaxID=2044937 RepID=A0A9D5Q6E0_9BACT|nr:gfo/Idh/MocA family oxidoreductase [candidate division KSB3 bacterium]MBD3324826.1 gfo/Idh/MocA family oxidoreductase [candidate division KSB3 bacterium]